MPTINGVKHRPVIATEAQKSLILKYRENKSRIKEILGENDLLLKTLSGEILDKVIAYDDGVEKRTIMISRPKGKYIYFSELDVIHDAMITKVDLVVFDENTVY